jgi:hypothetical protein
MSQSSQQYFRELAGFLRRDLRSDDSSRVEGSLRRIRRAVPETAATRPELLQAQFRHGDALTVIAREQGHPTWRDLEQALEAQRTAGASSTPMGLREGDPKFFETLITVSVLSEDTPYSFSSYSNLAYDVIHGECSGSVIEERSVRLSVAELEQRTAEHGSEPDFFVGYAEMNEDDDVFGSESRRGFWADDGVASHYYLGDRPEADEESAVARAKEILGDSLWQVYYEFDEDNREYVWPIGEDEDEVASQNALERGTLESDSDGEVIDFANTRFHYLYVDAANNKRRNSVLLFGRMTDDLFERFEATLEGGEFFIAHQVGIAGLIPSDADPDLDHCWHSIEGMADVGDVFEATLVSPRGGAPTVEEFVRRFEQATAAGWDDTWDPSEGAIDGDDEIGDLE